ncbi:hypothetical protein B1992_13255 [Pseudoxanthomonas broegbernensis]|uniref:Outer membrane protein beta-barrel domain-containing protein n=1 Tax=Pseudoxanthomonas broegbernensis TaxID=83619 RepID=A0A7V8K6G9_9GAMM|nr:hypothetical protein [Pseudoxanthomonas broegbernensis]KAF1685086.1 hypothetical protein B1992_13255 [Pseudoxanthomonas broegbernensis]MBB6066252.1 hypothetical protein [Pseudoxanthomonas broegbernensis]
MSLLPPCRLSLLAVLLAGAGAASAGPYEVGSTSTAQGVKFKSNVQRKHTASKDTWVLPKVGVGGPLSERLELTMGGGYGVVSRADGWTRGGLRDLSVGMKWRMRDEDDAHAALAIEPSLGLPIGDEAAGIGKGAYALELPLRASRRRGALRLTGEVSASRTFGRDEDQLGAGVLLEYFGGPAWSCGMELVADAPRTEPEAWHLRANVGAKRKFGPHVEWQALAGRTVENRRGQATTTFKLAYEYRF